MNDELMRAKSPLAVEQIEGTEGSRFVMSFRPAAVPHLAKAIAKEGHPVNGYSVEAVLMSLSELGDPAWARDLHFDSENDLFSVNCPRRAPLTFLGRRLQKRFANPGALRRLIKGASIDN